MTNRIELTEDQKKLLRKLISAKENFERLNNLAHSIEDNLYMKKEYDYLSSRASAYDFIYWKTLEELTGETIDTLCPASEDLQEEERLLEEEASKVNSDKELQDIFSEIIRGNQ